MNERREAELRKLDSMSIEEVRAFAKGLFGKDGEPLNATEGRCRFVSTGVKLSPQWGISSTYYAVRWSDAFRAALEAQEVEK